MHTHNRIITPHRSLCHLLNFNVLTHLSSSTLPPLIPSSHPADRLMFDPSPSSQSMLLSDPLTRSSFAYGCGFTLPLHHVAESGETEQHACVVATLAATSHFCVAIDGTPERMEHEDGITQLVLPLTQPHNRAVRDALMSDSLQYLCSHQLQLEAICHATLRASPHHHQPFFTADLPPSISFRSRTAVVTHICGPTITATNRTMIHGSSIMGLRCVTLPAGSTEQRAG
ncbi:uncharacterized protein M421DRAFT_153677 [Didymella exigua CBS 183.55]|uniref:Uncharacterized protein n=1 Tax=Didymella exigua CBS 183.55 TaxID=1150837 RepID=A0A6A5RNX7_9PLEO|nr:uncharacterized protein M421DRAFT_153677 [Didymella exigua CBS 183.55]KAF1928734.1 hypothetical protein M421DRAFT_153677 [Didymella exigua CBS 183.55]